MTQKQVIQLLTVLACMLLSGVLLGSSMLEWGRGNYTMSILTGVSGAYACVVSLCATWSVFMGD